MVRRAKTFDNKMKFLAILLVLLQSLAFGEDSFFFDLAKETKPRKHRVEGGFLHFAVPIEKLASPQATSIQAAPLDSGYLIQINLKEDPKWEGVPMLKLGEDIIDELTLAGPPNSTSACQIETDDPKKVTLWCKHLKTLLRVPDDKISITLNKADQARAGQPATPSESKRETNDKPQPKSEER